MQDQKKSEQQSPADIAREAFRRLAARRIAPTPDAYREIYEEIAGGQPATPQETGRSAQGKSVSLTGPIESASPKAGSIPLVDDPAPAKIASKGIPLVDDIALPAVKPPLIPPYGAGVASESPQLRMLRDLLIRTLTLAVGSLLQREPELLQEAEAIASKIKEARTEQSLNEISTRLKQLCFKIGLKSDDMAEEHELLLRLFKLLLENVGELLDDDAWLSGQIASVKELLSGPLSHAALVDATRSMKEVVYKQGMLKHSLSEAKASMKHMMITFIDRLAFVASTTSDYHEKIEAYAQKISKAQGIPELNKILEDVMRDTRIAQTEALRSRDQMVFARQEVQHAENRISELESRLEQMSELVREDQLTGSLNRRGLDDAFEREFARSGRRNTSLCIALLDLDDFKKLNDTYGHSAGDDALIHLVHVVKNTLRTMDVIGRFGGEEFLIVLPDTPLAEAIQTVTRIQRELTKQIFMHDHQRLLITFSAGVALRLPNEDQESLIKRADEALYKAKRAGKNRVVAAD